VGVHAQQRPLVDRSRQQRGGQRCHEQRQAHRFQLSIHVVSDHSLSTSALDPHF
jgi:hypothetical protein